MICNIKNVNKLRVYKLLFFNLFIDTCIIFQIRFHQFLDEKEDDIGNKFFVAILNLSSIDVKTIEDLLTKHNIYKIEDIKIESIALLLDYANFILRDNVISEEELNDFEILKKIFKIKEGDFFINEWSESKRFRYKQNSAGF